jgi:hypothetical protein
MIVCATAALLQVARERSEKDDSFVSFINQLISLPMMPAFCKLQTFKRIRHAIEGSLSLSLTTATKSLALQVGILLLE